MPDPARPGLPAGPASGDGPARPSPSAPSDPHAPVYLLASWGQRAKAYVLDVAIVFIPMLALWAMVIPGVVDRAGQDERLLDDLDVIADGATDAVPLGRIVFWLVMLLLAISLVHWLVMGVYSAVFMSRTAGQTPGKRLVGIRVMRADGRPIGFGWSLYRSLVLREVGFGLGSVLTAGGLGALQYLWPLWDGERRTLHDVAARSRVVADARQQ